MNKHEFWNAAVGIAIIGCFLGILAFIAYLIYGPGYTFVLPDYLGLNASTSAAKSLSLDILQERSGTLYICEEERALKAEFNEYAVNLSLSDGRQIMLPSASADGTQYTNTDGSFVFFTESSGSSVKENGGITYRNCVVSQ